MLICIGGFSGSGKRVLAQGLAKELEYYYYNIDGRKIRPSIYTKKGVVDIVHHPADDRERGLLYKRVVEDLPKLSKMYPDMVIDNVFHRRGVRDEFFRNARRYFSQVVVMWVDRVQQASTPLAQERRRVTQIGEFEIFEPPVPVFSYEGTPEQAQKEFLAFVQKHIASSRA